jgi:hypothetical protein
MAKPTLCLDFDGVIHSYSSGWKGAAVIPDPPVPGAMEFIVAAVDHFKVDIFSSRSADPLGRRAMWSYVKQHLEEAIGEIDASRIVSLIDFPFDKPAAFVSIDDRAITFDGSWPEIGALLAFKPWNKRPAEADGVRERNVLDILCMANERAEIGYADGSTKKAADDWDLVREAIQRGFIQFVRDASVGLSPIEGRPYEKRSIYKITVAGAAFLAAELKKARD